jgi:alginate O-acetyltransferase complex protein AlgI
VLFTTATFICLFLPITLLGFFGIGRFSHAGAALWLFVASVFFYGYWMPEFTLLLLGSIVANFLVSSKIARLVDAQAKAQINRTLTPINSLTWRLLHNSNL